MQAYCAALERHCTNPGLTLLRRMAVSMLAAGCCRRLLYDDIAPHPEMHINYASDLPEQSRSPEQSAERKGNMSSTVNRLIHPYVMSATSSSPRIEQGEVQDANYLDKMAGGRATLYRRGLERSYRPPMGFAAARMAVRAFSVACKHDTSL